jgi:hypothetical protein
MWDVICAGCSICGMEVTHKEGEIWLCDEHYAEQIGQ